MGVYFQTSKTPVIEDLFTVIVPAAHAKGMAVLASLNLHEPAWTKVNPEWGLAMANRTGQVFQPVGRVDPTLAPQPTLQDVVRLESGERHPPGEGGFYLLREDRLHITAEFARHAG